MKLTKEGLIYCAMTIAILPLAGWIIYKSYIGSERLFNHIETTKANLLYSAAKSEMTLIGKVKSQHAATRTVSRARSVRQYDVQVVKVNGLEYILNVSQEKSAIISGDNFYISHQRVPDDYDPKYRYFCVKKKFTACYFGEQKMN
tara:strand:- start:1462 stop:1896 length:435 start_codon:yes stop_codon:yes gene_type:complete